MNKKGIESFMLYLLIALALLLVLAGVAILFKGKLLEMIPKIFNIQ